MGLIGNLLSTAVNIVNLPAEIIDNVIMDEPNTLSAPLQEISKIVKKVDE